MLKNVIFHIGTPKTGTSIIQSHLAQNRRVLCGKGFLYPITISSDKKLYRTFESHHLLTYSLAGWAPFNRYSPDWFFERANMTGQQHGLHTLLLSAENTYWLPYQLAGAPKIAAEDYWDRKHRYLEVIRRYLSPYGIKVVVYLRRQDRWIESWYNQQVKNGFTFGHDMIQFVDQFSYLIDHEKNLELWSEVFGRDNLSVHVYEKEQLPDGLFSHFCAVTGVGNPEDFPLHRPARYNAQLTYEALQFMEICNNLMLNPDQKRRLRLHIRRATNQFSSQVVFKAQSLLSTEQRRWLLEKYAPMNERIAKIYLGREDGQLFVEGVRQEASTQTSDSGLSTEALVRLIMQVLMEVTEQNYGGGSRKQVLKRCADRLMTVFDGHLRPLVAKYRRYADDSYWNKHSWDYEQL